jgi:hypothetical protein
MKEAQMTDHSKRREGTGWTPMQCAHKTGLSYRRVRKGMENGDIRYVTIGGIDTILENEPARIIREMRGDEFAPYLPLQRDEDTSRGI